MGQTLARVAAHDPEAAPAPGRAAGATYRWVGTAGVLLFVALMAAFAPPRGLGDYEAVKSCDGETCRTTFEPVDGGEVITAQVRYDDPCIGEERCRSRITLRLTPADAADDALWLTALAYQGFHEHDPTFPTGQVSTWLVPTGTEGEYRSEDELPLYGDWKVFGRLHLAPTTMVGLLLHMPADIALDNPSAGLVEVADGSTVPFVDEPQMLQRERRDGVPIWLWTVAYSVVIAAWLALLAFYGWCFAAAARGGTTRAGSSGRHKQPA